MIPELEELKALFLFAWDPIGVSDCQGAEDEYDRYAMQVFVMLASKADADAIAAYLTQISTVHMSLPGHPSRDRDIAERAVAIHLGHTAI